MIVQLNDVEIKKNPIVLVKTRSYVSLLELENYCKSLLVVLILTQFRFFFVFLFTEVCFNVTLVHITSTQFTFSYYLWYLK